MRSASRTMHPLNGTWYFQPSNDATPPLQWAYRAPVPGLADCAEPQNDWKEFRHFWYRTTFMIEETSDLTFVVIEQAMFGTNVWLNGIHLGGDIACYTQQEYDTRGALRVGENELMICVGRREDLPKHSAVGNDQERSEWLPGIWGDVYLLHCGNPRIKLVQVIPHIDSGVAEARVWVENLSDANVQVQLVCHVLEKNSKKPVSAATRQMVDVPANSERLAIAHVTINTRTLWSPENPFLYTLESRLQNPASTLDRCVTTFGMREFKIVDGDFVLNGKKILLRGGNIAFHRFLSDADRGMLPWDLDWVKKALIDIPKAHNFNFFRIHLGHAYNRWYDIADAHGMLLQDEWMFWTTSGSKEQITHEFTRWLQDNWNHPSIIIWDALNECSDAVVQQAIVPEMKQLDPTRPWESVDIVEDHPYIYSLGPVLHDRTFGFTRSLSEIEHSSQPTMLNEFCWWWLDKEFNPTSLMNGVVERWLGSHWSKNELVAHQSFLVTELVELFRRMNVDAIQPFVYLSNNAGPTANWFVGGIRNLEPKPVLAALKNAFNPCGVSIELWDRHFFPAEQRTVRVFLFNDSGQEQHGKLRCGILNESGQWWFDTQRDVSMQPTEQTIVSCTLPFPLRDGACRIRAEILIGGECCAWSEKPAYVCSVPQASRMVQESLIAVAADGDLTTFLEERAMRVCPIADMRPKSADVLLVGEGMLFSDEYQSRLGAVTKFLESGRSLIVIEPEYGVHEPESVQVALGLALDIRRREDRDKGGYDSYVFMEDDSHPLWKGISPEHLKMFNGGYGGEIVSQHDVQPNRDSRVLARCGLGLAVPAAFEIPYAKGKVIISRLQLRGRLVKSSQPGQLFARRPDPVVQRYLVNLLSYAVESSFD